jgi:signal recognition particle GTPase
MANITVKNDSNPKIIQTFKDFGTFENNIDEFGNVNLNYVTSPENDAQHQYVKLTLRTFQYNESKIKDTSDTSFSELTTVETETAQDIEEILTQYNITLAENKNLNEIINRLIDKYENNNDKSIINAMKNEMINLRIQMKQGNHPSDFQDEFPFLPIS